MEKSLHLVESAQRAVAAAKRQGETNPNPPVRAFAHVIRSVFPFGFALITLGTDSDHPDNFFFSVNFSP